MNGSEEHYGKQQIYRYVRGLISGKALDHMEAHLCSCNECLLRTVHLRHMMIQACTKASNLFDGYFNKTLGAVETVFVESHLIGCDLCADDYGALVERNSSAVQNV